MLLTDLAAAYARAKLPGSPRNTVGKYAYAIDHFEAHLGHAPTLIDLNEPNVLGYAWWLVRTCNKSLYTASGYQSRLLAIWRFACRQGLLSVYPEQQKLKVPKRTPVAWSQHELSRLWRACELVEGEIDGVPAGLWWLSLHSGLWDTAERIRATMSVRWEDVNLDSGWLTIRAEHRKGCVADKQWRLHPHTVELLRAIRLPDRKLVWPWPWDNTMLYYRYAQILKSAGLPFDRNRKFHCIRKSAASWFEAAGGDATALLGHSSRAMTLAYLSPQIVATVQASDLLFRPGSLPT